MVGVGRRLSGSETQWRCVDRHVSCHFANNQVTNNQVTDGT